jgi:head-tail adaptor
MEGIGGTFVGLTMEADYRFTGRYRTGITPRWRLELGSRVFAIVRPPQDPDGKRVTLVIYAKEILS